ncbi:hypothetical protein LTR35_010248 [Friedmanniomyces endolithicus]|uniref:FAD-binding domain-containing protein n=1 Tax=Friedmanniomyces endolithicus TaxID=329885 RepID=A0AAN6FBM3_9PEZI|nr:hypothetical protein LTR35_010248 [Friedmanniomyces endolithicus]KAK0282733.1 hypothetical protein LTS00_012035 [Friedmanniomyces endolithicus]KAK0311622.1 hypothetical protein LTR82_014324 [Friedmanniomyces endolithicus]KAK0987545.1 hypothetical protein LTR54_013137 [Friedmanniomyces endolithicus]
MPPPQKVLISGAGIAGSVLAFWLHRATPTTQITLIERAPALRLTGASVDIRGSAIDVVKLMGLLDKIREQTTPEAGVQCVRADGSTAWQLGATGREEMQSVTSEYEIFRGALARILLEPIEGKVELVLGEWVEGFEQGEKGVDVRFGNGMESGSPGGRVTFLRPDPDPRGRTRAYLCNVTLPAQTKERDRLNEALEQGDKAYMTMLEDLFKYAGWLAPAVLKGMRESDDFYCSLFAQTRSPKLCNGRVVLLGDAGYATPGIGTSLAIIGGYVLAGESLRHDGDMVKACKAYEDLMLPYAKSQQKGGGAMRYANPQTAWGIAARNAVMGAATGLMLDRVVMAGAAWLGFSERKLAMPEYPWPAQ